MSWYQRLLEKLKTVNLFKGMQALREERGAIFVLTALMLPVLLGCLGFAYDAGNLYMHKARLQNTADAAALAGGRAYVNALSEHASNGVVSSIPDDEKAEAKRTMKTNAEQYIRNNNPLFAEKTGKEEKFWFGTKSTAVGANTNSTEYFRVNLTEPVHLYFLPVIGIQDSMDVKAYATTKLTDTVVNGDGNNQQVDAENSPVVIAGSVFYDEINTNDLNNPSNFYNTSTVYVQEGGSVTGIEVVHEGKTKHVVPSSEGDIIINGKRYAEIVETKYDMAAFGESIKQRFREKQEVILTSEEKSRLNQYKTEKSNWNKGYNEYLEAYQTWIQSGSAQYVIPQNLSDAKEIYNQLNVYLNIFNGSVLWKGIDSDEYRSAKQKWIDDGKPLTDSEELFQQVMLSGLQNYFPEPTEGNWGKLSESPCNQLGIMKRNGNRAPVLSTFTSKYTAFDHEPDLYKDYGLDEYYMTYHGSINNIANLNTMDISSNPSNYGLKSDEHSYLYISRAALNPPTTDGNISEINVNGFYISPTPTTDVPVITGDTPYYIFIDADMNQRVNVKVTANCNRPLVLCYLGTTPVHYEFNANLNVRGVFYSPYAGNDTLVNGTANNVTFSGSIISDYLKIQSHNTSFQYNPEEIKRWQEASEGLPSTPNVGFTGSSGGGNGGEATEKITLAGRLRLFLAGNSNQNNYYNPDDGSWNWTQL